jgi:hypothetical protein
MMAGRLSAPAARAHTNSLAGRLRIGVENSVTGEEIARYFKAACFGPRLERSDRRRGPAYSGKCSLRRWPCVARRAVNELVKKH